MGFEMGVDGYDVLSDSFGGCSGPFGPKGAETGSFKFQRNRRNT